MMNAYYICVSHYGTKSVRTKKMFTSNLKNLIIEEIKKIIIC